MATSNHTPERGSTGTGADFWSPAHRVAIFTLASNSILSLLFEFYRICPMQSFTLFISIPAWLLLIAWAIADRAVGSQRLWRWIAVGGLSGLIAAAGYDVFRLPFVFAHELGIDQIVPPLQLFKVFPRFGALILGQPLEQTAYSMPAQWLGWLYHFSNGVAFGIMYVALVGDAGRRHWAWAMLFAVGLELGMLLTPYPAFFGIALTLRFIVVTVAAHLIFGLVLGLLTLALSKTKRQ